MACSSHAVKASSRSGFRFRERRRLILMANVVVQKIDSDKPAPALRLKELKDTFENIRKRAFQLFERRGGAPGGELEDWVQAERDLFWIPRAELAETDTEFKIHVGVPGMDAKNLEVTA